MVDALALVCTLVVGGVGGIDQVVSDAPRLALILAGFGTQVELRITGLPPAAAGPWSPP